MTHVKKRLGWFTKSEAEADDFGKIYRFFKGLRNKTDKEPRNE